MLIKKEELEKDLKNNKTNIIRTISMLKREYPSFNSRQIDTYLEETPLCDWRSPPADGNWKNHGCKFPDDDKDW